MNENPEDFNDGDNTQKSPDVNQGGGNADVLVETSQKTLQIVGDGDDAQEESDRDGVEIIFNDFASI